MIETNTQDLTKYTWDFQHLFNQPVQPIFQTDKGALFEEDCLNILHSMNSSSVNLIFADPPFNLGKKYGAKVNDQRSENEYLLWMKSWITECTRILNDGGSIFIYNLPKWNIFAGNYLNDLGLNFRHWITVDIKMSMPIKGRLYPSHYSLLYYCKGDSPTIFKRIRTPIQLCRHCGGEIKDYGGHRKSMNPNGVTLSDVWCDITPVRHWKYKSKKRKTNQLSTKLLSRVIEMATNPGDIVFDPFGGSGTTFSVCEAKHRHWLGSEIESCDVIIERLTAGEVYHHQNDDYIEEE
ncbi:DNA methylase [Picosynechococcus sp. PCC 7003]|uniref:DNA-methyltransferase n=1 Tax=Picosynechococcus sp. PCC 7003 TaxID=374981 RepID=UPI000810F0B4|nr:site-specific DNA-methyltransferase [Picosynechococcus sp. PCC 7003]ANV83240.1 DNA methylase [Picosynechococcus sp. PCC 7003]